jgi:ABC-type multidrug transport system fused ATPase/permease subunit
MSDLSQMIHSMTWSGLIPVGLLMVVGLLLWAAGRRILRAGFVLVGLGVGGVIGWLVGDSIKLGVQPSVVMGIAAVGFAVVAGLSYRMALVAAMAAVCGLLAPLAVLTLAQNNNASADPSPKPSVVASSGLMSGFREIFQEQSKVQSQSAESVNYWRNTLKEHDRLAENADKHIEQVQSFAQRVTQTASNAWTGTPQFLRPMLVASAVIGTIAGLLLGIIAPVLGASAVTSFGGSMLWLSGGRVFAAGMGAPDSWWPQTGTGWFTLWLITATFGLVIQWAFRRRLADKSG